LNQTTCQIRVRYAETDGMGVVYYGNYLTWFEVGRADLLRQLGESYRKIEETEKIHLPVIEAHCRYHKPARYDDLVDIVTRLSRPSRAQVRFDYELSRAEDGALLASGTTLHVAVGRDGRPCRLPKKLRDILE
jgi:acyl-CoA thioester hydrolase